MNKNKILAITIDEIIRDFNEQFDNIYRKKFMKNPGLDNMKKNFEVVLEDEQEEEFKRLEEKANALIHLPITTESLINHYEFDSYSAYESFLENHSLELYGSAGQIPGGMQETNKLYFNKTKIGLEDVILVCPGNNQKIISTLHFLVKTGCKVGHIIFLSDLSEIWNYSNIVITDRPEIINSAPEGSKIIKVEKEYNKKLSSNATINSLKELEITKFTNLLLNNKYE